MSRSQRWRAETLRESAAIRTRAASFAIAQADAMPPDCPDRAELLRQSQDLLDAAERELAMASAFTPRADAA